MTKSGFVERNLKILFPLPAVAFVVVMMLFPVLYTLFLSFTNWNLTSGMPLNIVWLKSYLRVFNEPRFISAVGRTFSFTLLAVAVETALGLALALLLNREFWGKSAMKLILLLPLVATPVAIGIVWNLFFDPTIGFMNYMLSLLGLPMSEWVSNTETVNSLPCPCGYLAMDAHGHPHCPGGTGRTFAGTLRIGQGRRSQCFSDFLPDNATDDSADPSLPP